jgi:hypothetical protein
MRSLPRKLPVFLTTAEKKRLLKDLLQGVESLPQRVPGILGEFSCLVRGLGGDHAGT